MKIMKNISSYMLNSQFLRLIAEHVTFLKVRKFRKKFPKLKIKLKGIWGQRCLTEIDNVDNSFYLKGLLK